MSDLAGLATTRKALQVGLSCAAVLLLAALSTDCCRAAPPAKKKPGFNLFGGLSAPAETKPASPPVKKGMNPPAAGAAPAPHPAPTAQAHVAVSYEKPTHRLPPVKSVVGSEATRNVQTVTPTAWQPPPADADALPPPPLAANRVLRVPLGDPSIAERVQITAGNDRISLTARDAPLNAVLALIAQQHNLNVITAEEVTQRISVTLTDVRLEDALDAIVSVNGYTWARQRNIIMVTPIAADKRSSPLLQGRKVQVFSLNYIAAADADKVVKGLLSPVGQSFTNQSSPTDQRRTSETLVVEDLPAYLERIADYLQQVDQPPRQVVVESHVLEVTLKDGCAHGVNFSQLMKLAGADVTLEAVGLANPAATPASFLRISGGSLDGLIEALKTTNNTKTLASPKLTVLNGQTAQIQIGAKLGYQTLQTTQTATMQNVNFLDTGVILKVTPIISQDNQIMLQVKPQVSDGAIDTTSGLPNSNTTEVDTKVLMADGEAIVIGGLIRESDIEIKNRIPILGDIKYVGTLFQRRSVQRQRTEIIITLLTRLVPDAPGCRQDDPAPIDRTQTPLFYGPLYRMDRRQWESEIPQGLPAYKGLTPEGGIFETYTQPPPPEMPAIPSRGSVELLPPPSFEER